MSFLPISIKNGLSLTDPANVCGENPLRYSSGEEKYGPGLTMGGTQATACSRWVITAKSPHSYPDQYGFGNGGGMFGAALKQFGYDGLLVRGKAFALSYILMKNGK